LEFSLALFALLVDFGLDLCRGIAQVCLQCRDQAYWSPAATLECHFGISTNPRPCSETAAEKQAANGISYDGREY